MYKAVRYIYLSILLYSGLFIEKMMGLWFVLGYMAKHRKLPRKPSPEERERFEAHLIELMEKERETKGEAWEHDGPV